MIYLFVCSCVYVYMCVCIYTHTRIHLVLYVYDIMYTFEAVKLKRRRIDLENLEYEFDAMCIQILGYDRP